MPPFARAQVYLVGAGPGDPGLITVRAARLLEAADVVVFDHLASERLLGYCPHAERIYVGKQAAAHSMTQDQINALLVERAQAGKRVVRLKGGDPFVFGRGGEECEVLARAGIRFEVVPGITSAIAAGAYAGIPVTHRDINSSFTVVTGHEREDEYRDPRTVGRESAAAPTSDIDWGALAKLPCLAFYMGVKALPRICARLIEHGKPVHTPAATVHAGTTPRQRTVVATLADLPARVVEAEIGAPAITIVGEVVTLRETINWFETRPLFGQTIAITRTRQQASELSLHLDELGARVIEAPTIEVQPLPDTTAIDDLFRAENRNVPFFDWVVFTSANGVQAARQRLRALGRDARAFGDARIAVIGDVTRRAVEDQLNLHVDLCPDSFVAEALAAALASSGQVAGKRFLLLRADIARPVLREKLLAAGAAEVRDVAIYETKRAARLPRELLDLLDAAHVDWITFTSSSTVTNFIDLLGVDRLRQLRRVRLASIGPITTETMRRAGLTPAVEASVYTVEGLVEAILTAAAKPGNEDALPAS